MVFLTTRGIVFFGTNQENGVVVVSRAVVDKPLRVLSVISANGANGSIFFNLVGPGHEVWHGPKRFTAKVHIEAGTVDLQRVTGFSEEEVVDKGEGLADVLVEELSLIDKNGTKFFPAGFE